MTQSRNGNTRILRSLFAESYSCRYEVSRNWRNSIISEPTGNTSDQVIIYSTLKNVNVLAILLFVRQIADAYRWESRDLRTKIGQTTVTWFIHVTLLTDQKFDHTFLHFFKNKCYRFLTLEENYFRFGFHFIEIELGSCCRYKINRAIIDAWYWSSQKRTTWAL